MINKKIQASSLVEVIVAMVILMLSFGAAILLFVKVTKSNKSLQQVQHQSLVNEFVAQTKMKRAFINRIEKHEDKLLIQNVQPYRNNHALLFLDVELRNDQDSLLFEHNELIYLGAQLGK